MAILTEVNSKSLHFCVVFAEDKALGNSCIMSSLKITLVIFKLDDLRTITKQEEKDLFPSMHAQQLFGNTCHSSNC